MSTSAPRAPPLPLRSQDGACLGRVVSIVSHCIFWPFAVRYPGTFSALNSAGSVSVNALRTESQCLKCASTQFETWPKFRFQWSRWTERKSSLGSTMWTSLDEILWQLNIINWNKHGLPECMFNVCPPDYVPRLSWFKATHNTAANEGTHSVIEGPVVGTDTAHFLGGKSIKVWCVCLASPLWLPGEGTNVLPIRVISKANVRSDETIHYDY